MNPMQITAEMERFMESHDDVPFAEHIGGAFNMFKLIRVANGDEFGGFGDTMQEAYEDAGRQARK